MGDPVNFYIVRRRRAGDADECYFSARPGESISGFNGVTWETVLACGPGSHDTAIDTLRRQLQLPEHAKILASLAGALTFWSQDEGGPLDGQRAQVKAFQELEIGGVVYNRGVMRLRREFSKPMEDLLDILDESGIRKRD